MSERLTIRTDICCEPENDIIYSNPKDPEGMYSILDLAKHSEDGDGTESGILLEISNRLAKYEDAEEERKSAIIKKESFRCENCKHLLESENTNRLWCSYHSDGEYQHETYKDDYCSYFERR